MDRICYLCRREDDDTGPRELRPYGEAGQLVCWVCAMSTPERKAEAERRMFQRIDAVRHAADRLGGLVVIGGNDGPVHIPPILG